MVSVVAQGEDIFGVAAVTTELVEEARERHGTSPIVAVTLGRLLTGGVLMGTTLKEPWHRIVLQINCRGPVQRLVVEADGAGHVRGYPEAPRVSLRSRADDKIDVSGVVGPGMLHVTREVGMKEPTTGAVPLVSGEIGEDLASYLLQSEQIPSAVSLGVFAHPSKLIIAAGGFIVQFHAEMDDEIIEHVEQSLAKTKSVTEMIREGRQPQEMLESALGGMAMDVVRTTTPTWHCPCSRSRVTEVLIAMGEAEMRQMMAEEEETHVTCDYCAADYVFSRPELEALLTEATTDA